MENNILHFLSIISDTAKIVVKKKWKQDTCRNGAWLRISWENTFGYECCDQKNKCINKEKFVMA